MMKEDKKGFTIIEVVLVLAIAGLIFIMVFIAMPALRRNQRDQVRVRNISTIISLMDQYRSHNSGRLPGTDSKGKPCINNGSCSSVDSLNKYLNNYAIELVEPSRGQGYEFSAAGGDGNSCVDVASEVNGHSDFNHIGFCYETTCEGDNMSSAESFKKAQNNYVFTIIYRKEVGDLICQDNNG